MGKNRYTLMGLMGLYFHGVGVIMEKTPEFNLHAQFRYVNSTHSSRHSLLPQLKIDRNKS